jgi:hypothetical protein
MTVPQWHRMLPAACIAPNLIPVYMIYWSATLVCAATSGDYQCRPHGPSYGLTDDKDAPHAGLTSNRHIDFVNSINACDSVLSYAGNRLTPKQTNGHCRYVTIPMYWVDHIS